MSFGEIVTRRLLTGTAIALPEAAGPAAAAAADVWAGETATAAGERREPGGQTAQGSSSERTSRTETHQQQ